jgi:hypothetical protein
MKSFCCFVAIAVCLGITGAAHASSIVGFATNILDPLTGGVPEAANSFAISFTQCSTFSNAGEFPTDISTGPNTADYGCFEGVNATVPAPNDIHAAWTSLDMTFGNNSFLAGQTPSCGGIDSNDSIFLSTTCSYDPTTQIYTLDFSDGTIAPGDSFLIVEETAITQFDSNGVSQFGIGTVTVNVPEPNPALLMATGAAMFGLLLYAERRRLLRQSMNS